MMDARHPLHTSLDQLVPPLAKILISFDVFKTPLSFSHGFFPEATLVLGEIGV